MIIKGLDYYPVIQHALLNSLALSATIFCVSNFEGVVSVAIAL